MPGPFPPPFSHDEFLARLAALPLALQPGEGWLYHTSSDVLSVLLARAAGGSLTDLLGDLITGPLGMRDTGFHTRELERLATAYNPSGQGLEVLDLPAGRFSRPPRFEAFGSGLVSTVPDYLALLEMLAAGGAPTLRPEAVAALGSDQLSEHQRATAQLFMGESFSWGLGCQVALSPSVLALEPGSFGWMGGTGTIGYVDPSRSLAAVLFTQRAMENNRPTPGYIDFWDAVYQGL